MLNHGFVQSIKKSAQLLALSAIAFSSPTAALANAGNWPEHELKLIVPFGAGSTPDQIARIVAEQASSSLGQVIVIDNKPGAGGNIGTAAVAHAKPDGYTFGISITGPLVNNQFIYNNLSYDPEKDLAPLTMAVTQPNIIAVRSDSGIKTLQELINKIKENPDKFNYATAGTGTGSHLSMELMLQAANGIATAVPYASSPNAMNSLLAGDTQFTALAPIAILPLVKDGRLTALAQTTAERVSALPDIPTVSEAGVPGIEGSAWSGFVISSKVEPAIQDKLAKALVEALNHPAVKEKLQTQYMDPIPGTPEQFGKYMQQEKARWQPLIEKLDLKIN
ncbi:Bug family tripartite tricarboxylate transporter substrate binding protein [Advenella sp. RU8]|uniref:Bug family tripartite tricarboxylate transporter substrate binding protein n=1 Tax=Advenella sp. RU8 TaxID=3399575 RepID=UPI003AAE8386